MVYLSHIQIQAEDACAERFANRFVPRFTWASCLPSALYSKAVYAQREIRAQNWGLWIICCESNGQQPAITSPYQCSWPIDFAVYMSADSDLSKRRFMLDTMHEACLWVANRRSWPVNVFEGAYQEVLDHGLEFRGFVGRAYPSPDRRFTVRIHCDYGIEWIHYSAVLCRYRSKKEIARQSLGKLRPAVGRVADDVKGGNWVRGKRFVLSSQFHYDWAADFSEHISRFNERTND